MLFNHIESTTKNSIYRLITNKKIIKDFELQINVFCYIIKNIK